MSLFHASALPDPDGIADLSEALETFLRRHAVDSRTRHHVLLGIEELLANLHDHAGAAESPAEVRLTVEPARVLAEISDSGTPFDPREAPAPDLELRARRTRHRRARPASAPHPRGRARLRTARRRKPDPVLDPQGMSMDHHALLLDALPTGAALLDRKGALLACNAALRRMLGAASAPAGTLESLLAPLEEPAAGRGDASDRGEIVAYRVAHMLSGAELTFLQATRDGAVLAVTARPAGDAIALTFEDVTEARAGRPDPRPHRAPGPRAARFEPGRGRDHRHQRTLPVRQCRA